MGRLTDNDKRFRCLTWGRSDWAALRVMFSTGDGDESPKNSLTVNAFGWVARTWLPKIMEPHRIKHTAKSWDAATVARMGRDWYYEYFPKEYGFCFTDGSVSVHYGPQTHSSVDTKSKLRFLPWKQWRHVRYSLYDRAGELFWEQRQKTDIRGMAAFTDQYEAKKACPSVSFLIRDYDGQVLTARTVIDEREWKRGEKWCSWLSWFYPAKLRRRLEIDFSDEVGHEKGSWKGGLMGTSIDMLPGELHESAMRRYCAAEHLDKSGKYRVDLVSTL